MTKWQCPYAKRLRSVEFLVCEKLLQEGVDYMQVQNAANAFCANQFRCPCSGKAENTATAKKCYEYHAVKG